MRRQKVEILQNIFNRYFVEHVQPVGSQLNHYFYSLQPLLNTLAKHPLAPQSLQQFIFEFSQRFDAYQQAMKATLRCGRQSIVIVPSLLDKQRGKK